MTKQKRDENNKILHDLLVITENVITGTAFMTTSVFDGYLEYKIQSPKNHPTVILIYENNREEGGRDERPNNFIIKTELNKCELSGNPNSAFAPFQLNGDIVETDEDDESVTLEERGDHTEEKSSVSFNEIRQNFPMTKPKPFVCKFCQKSFTHNCRMMKHMRTHTGDKPYQCIYCKKCFNDEINKNRHEILHASGKYISPEEYQKQQEIYSGYFTENKSFICNYCQKEFNKRNNIIRHIKTHTGERAYQCDYCEKRFIDLDNLNRHERSHTGERPYLCGYCDLAFSQISSKKRHEQRKHSGRSEKKRGAKKKRAGPVIKNISNSIVVNQGAGPSKTALFA